VLRGRALRAGQTPVWRSSASRGRRSGRTWRLWSGSSHGATRRSSSDFYAPQGTTDHLLLVDAEVGTILRAAARLEGREFYVAEVTEVAYDEQVSGDTFQLDLPGVEFRTRTR
jgi:hypothetical protein